MIDSTSVNYAPFVNFGTLGLTSNSKLLIVAEDDQGLPVFAHVTDADGPMIFSLTGWVPDGPLEINVPHKHSPSDDRAVITQLFQMVQILYNTAVGLEEALNDKNNAETPVIVEVEGRELEEPAYDWDDPRWTAENWSKGLEDE